MTLLTLEQADLLTGFLSFVFTVALFSYLLGDNPVYRLALHLFIGVSIGYVTLVVIYHVLYPRLVVPLLSGDIGVIGLATVPLVLFIFLALKLNPRTSALGNISIAYLIGVGTAIATGGAISGTLIPQIRATWLSLLPGGGRSFINNIVIVAGAITTLLYFQFWIRGKTSSGEARQMAIMQLLSKIGQGFMVLTMGVIYGGIILSGLAVFSERLTALTQWLTNLAP